MKHRGFVTIRVLCAISFLLGYGLIGTQAFAGYCQRCQKIENINTIRYSSDHCTPNNECNYCNYYHIPDYNCPLTWGKNCTITSVGNPPGIAATVYQGTCNAGSSCTCMGSGGSPIGTITVAGESCVTTNW